MDEEQIEKAEAEETESEQNEVDLNRVFRDEERDLNSMFPDGNMRKFLRQLDRNRRGNKRFIQGIEQAGLWEED